MLCRASRFPPFAIVAVSAVIIIGRSCATEAIAAAAPPAQASAVTSPAAEAPAPPPQTPVDPGTARSRYQPLVPGLLARTLFTTSATAPVAVDLVDILIGPGQSARLSANAFAALIDIEAGAALLSVDGKPVTAKPGTSIAIAQGQTINIDNRQGRRTFLARLVKLSATAR
jgi:hypothetical protein